ncbi:MAG: ArsA-related P-loop ATPase [Deltaproteobacteria bacterium]
MNLDELFNKKLVVVTGKGGVGKTTVSLALSYLNSRFDRDSIYVTLNEIKKDSYFFGFNTGINSREKALDNNLWSVAIDPNTALKEYVRENFVNLYPVYATILKSKTLQNFFEAAPGLMELITIGKVWHLGNRNPQGRKSRKAYDQVIFDAPSTGHAIPILDLPSRVLDMVRGGAFKSHIGWVESFLKDPDQAAVVVVATPEEMVVRETIELIDSVKSLGINVIFTVVNNAYEKMFDKKEVSIIKELLTENKGAEISPAVELAFSHAARTRMSEKYTKKLRKELKEPVLIIHKRYKRDLAVRDLKSISSELRNQLDKSL